MTRIKANREEMEQSRIDAILATEEDLLPSSGFLATVMESVREEARLPQPIPFPWKRAVPGILLAGGVFAWGAFELFRYGLPAVSGISLTRPHLAYALERPFEEAGWVALALGASLLSWLLSRRLAGRSGLL
jgi:hypothetical protein